jgi:hypothetical protein
MKANELQINIFLQALIVSLLFRHTCRFGGQPRGLPLRFFLLVGAWVVQQVRGVLA